ncbi:MAG: type II toxin-antitoxin system RelE/ParE family toxin [Magnetococcales bacterium]|nr:type II toxin-antitoxin system RelE/ParE family toxin [Magnetococcales bacterium]
MKSAHFSREAQRDILEASRWMVARAFQKVMKQAATTLGEYPLAGMERPDLVNPPFRFFVITGFPYVIVYNPTMTPPLILRVFHGARDLPELLEGL